VSRAAPARAQLLISAALAVAGAAVLAVAAGLPGRSSYSPVGANFVPFVVGIGLLGCGLLLLWQALRGGWPDAVSDDAAARGEHPFHAGAFGWISAGLFLHMALVKTAGFVIAGALLFTCVARGFGSTRPLRDAAIGVVITLAVFVFFVKLLNVNLPAGWLKPLLGAAGI
jgi:putative tricarboxylic transport membrane protein